MNVDACFELGHIHGTHGLRGEVHVLLDVDQPESYYKLESVLLSQPGSGPLIPFFIEYLKPQGRKLIVKFEEAGNQDEAKALVGSSMYLPLTQLPALAGSEFYFHEIIGCLVVDTNAGPLGNVTALYDQTPQLLIGMRYQNHEVLIPFTDDIVLGFNREQNEISTTLPEGLLDIYLNEENNDHED